MDDIVKRLRSWADMFRGGHAQKLTREAADEIERLRQSVIEMRQLLDEFWKTCTEEHNSVEMFVLHRASGHAIARAYDAVPEAATVDDIMIVHRSDRPSFTVSPEEARRG